MHLRWHGELLLTLKCSCGPPLLRSQRWFVDRDMDRWKILCRKHPSFFSIHIDGELTIIVVFFLYLACPIIIREVPIIAIVKLDFLHWIIISLVLWVIVMSNTRIRPPGYVVAMQNLWLIFFSSYWDDEFNNGKRTLNQFWRLLWGRRLNFFLFYLRFSFFFVGDVFPPFVAHF